MINRRFDKPCFRWSAVGLAAALLFGCGGGNDGSSAQSAQGASVQVNETATTLSVKTALPPGSTTTSSEMQSMVYTFAAHVASGPDAGYSLKGTLVLKGESEDGGATQVEGRLIPDVMMPPTPALAASAAELETQFNAKRQALKDALRADIDALSGTLKQALAAGAVAGSTTPSAAQKEALATFKSAFSQRMTQYRSDLAALIAQYSAASGGTTSHDDGGSETSSEGYEVHGTIDAQGAIALTVSLGDKGKVQATGILATDGSASGMLAGPASADKGTWNAKAISSSGSPPPPPPVGDPALGAVVYRSCALCHGPDPVTKSLNIQLGVTVAALESAFMRVVPMNGFTTSLSATDKLNLAAYIKSRVGP